MTIATKSGRKRVRHRLVVRSPIDDTADKMRKIALASPDGSLISSEDELVARLAVSRITVRQAARRLEREGVLRVRRGTNGGYFAMRPSQATVIHEVCGYLDTLGLDARHTETVATALWIEVMREAAAAEREDARTFCARYVDIVETLDAATSIEALAELELEIRSALFDLIGGGYMELIFAINVSFARRTRDPAVDLLDADRQRSFVERWRKAKLMELEAIADGDETLAMVAALHMRTVWIKRNAG